MRIGMTTAWMCSDVEGYVAGMLRASGHEVVDFGESDCSLPDDQYLDEHPGNVLRLAEAVARGEVDRGVALCDGGPGACIVANTVDGVHAGLVYFHERFSGHEYVEGVDGYDLRCCSLSVFSGHEFVEAVDADVDFECLRWRLASKVYGIHAGLIYEAFSARQGVQYRVSHVRRFLKLHYFRLKMAALRRIYGSVHLREICETGARRKLALDEIDVQHINLLCLGGNVVVRPALVWDLIEITLLSAR